MKKLLLVLPILFFVNTLLSQTDENEVLVTEKITETTSYLTTNDLETFKNQFEEWNVDP